MKYAIRLCSYIVLLISLLVCTSCSKPIDATQVALDYYTLIVKQDAAPLTQDGLNSDEVQATITYMNITLKDSFKTAFTWDEQVLINSEQLNKLALAYTNALKRLNATAQLTSTNGDSQCSVTLTTTYIDHQALDELASQTALDSIEITTYTDHNLYLKDLSQIYIEELIKGYETFSPTNETHSETFTFRLVNKMWCPADFDSFFTTLCTMTAAKP